MAKGHALINNNTFHQAQITPVFFYLPFCRNAKFVHIPTKLSMRKVDTTIIHVFINLGKYAEIIEKSTHFPQNIVRPNPIKFYSEHEQHPEIN